MSDDAMRIHRALARAGVASRRKAEELVAAGRVRVNGAVAKTGQSVDPARDVITVDGEQLARPQKPTLARAAQAGRRAHVAPRPAAIAARFSNSCPTCRGSPTSVASIT